MAKPGILRSNAGIASRIAAIAQSGRQVERSAGFTPGRVRGQDAAERRRGPPGEEVTDALRRGVVVLTASLERPLLPKALELDAGERSLRGSRPA